MLMDVIVLVRQDGDKYFKSNISVILLMYEIIDIETLTLVTQWYPSGAQNIVIQQRARHHEGYVNQLHSSESKLQFYYDASGHTHQDWNSAKLSKIVYVSDNGTQLEGLNEVVHMSVVGENFITLSVVGLKFSIHVGCR